MHTITPDRELLLASIDLPYVRQDVAIPTIAGVKLERLEGNCWGFQPDDRRITVLTDSKSSFGRVNFEVLQQAKLVLINSAAIQHVFIEQPTLEALVHEAYDQLRARFLEGHITLSTSIDPEEPGTPLTLVLKVKTTQDFEQAATRWGDFKESWWLPNYDRGDDRLSILLTF